MRDNLRGKNLSVPDSQQDWWKSSQPARCTSVQPATGLTVKFPSRRPGSLVGGVGGGGWGGKKMGVAQGGEGGEVSDK